MKELGVSELCIWPMCMFVTKSARFVPALLGDACFGYFFFLLGNWKGIFHRWRKITLISRWLSDLEVQKTVAFLWVAVLNPGEKSACLYLWHFHTREDALLGRVYSRTHLSLQCIHHPVFCLRDRMKKHLLWPSWHIHFNKPRNSAVNFRKGKCSCMFGSIHSLRFEGQVAVCPEKLGLAKCAALAFLPHSLLSVFKGYDKMLLAVGWAEISVLWWPLI